MNTSLDNPHNIIAAIDLGSNSFHMIVTRVNGSDFQIIDNRREMVRLGAGLDEDKNLTPEAEERALNCLENFAESVRLLPLGSVKAVGTNTLRQVKHPDTFLAKAEGILGHPIDIIGGREEARLVYLGVAHSVSSGEKRRLVVDIGGGSTELIVGDSFKSRHMVSLRMGCVSMSLSHFARGAITLDIMRSAELRGALELRPVKNEYRSAGWKVALGSSGTIRAIRNVVQAAGWTEVGQGITAEGLEKLRNSLIEQGHVDQIKFEGLSEERRPVFVGGVVVLRSVFKALNIKQMLVSDMALREGLIYDMLGRIHHEDVRNGTVKTLIRRYEIDKEQGQSVETTARSLFAQSVASWNLASNDYADALGWAARLHEIGLMISHSGYHKHGGYLLAHADMPGFSRNEQILLSVLVRCHRRKIPQDAFDAIPDSLKLPMIRLCVILRISTLLHRSRSSNLRYFPVFQVTGHHVTLIFPDGWLDENKLHQIELKEEAKRLKKIDISLKYE